MTGDDCKKLGAERGSNKKLVACLQPDRRVEIEVLGSREVAAGGAPAAAPGRRTRRVSGTTTARGERWRRAERPAAVGRRELPLARGRSRGAARSGARRRRAP